MPGFFVLRGLFNAQKKPIVGAIGLDDDSFHD